LSLGGFLLGGGAAAGFGFLLWRLSTMRTDPAGYSQVGSFHSRDAKHVVQVLEEAGIPVRAEDHTTRFSPLGGPGAVRLLVPTQRLDEAILLLRQPPPAPSGDAPPV